MGTPEKFQISKHQKPNSKHQRHPKFQALNRGQRFELGAWSFSGVWSLVFGTWCFFGAWSLEFGACCTSDPPLPPCSHSVRLRRMSLSLTGQFPAYRPRRLRQSPALRRLMAETRLSAAQLVLPLFVRPGRKLRRAIAAMPGVFQLSPDELLREASQAHGLGVPAILVFGIPASKDAKASGAYARNGIVQQTVRLLKKEVPELVVITDVCLCEYTSHGHCGLAREGGDVLNDESVELLGRAAVAYAAAGADIVAPSAMLDGMVAGVRDALNAAQFECTPIMS